MNKQRKRKIIRVLADWDSTKDKHEFEDRYGPSENYRLDALDKLADEIKRFGEVLNDAMTLFLPDLELAVLTGPLVTVQEKIDCLTQLVRDLGTRPEIRNRLLESLGYCGWVERKRHRLMSEARRALSIAWIAPFCELSDEMGSAGMQLEESFRSESDGYKAHVYFTPAKPEPSIP